ncbi:MAG: hypothetical protein NZ942_02755 [Candidatus Aenigmarchaeota archaeon]|nr:hypothetical protein [Candidatus Aenigmarchaeota archaeon]
MMEIPAPVIKRKRNSILIAFVFVLIFLISFFAGIRFSGQFVRVFSSEECESNLKELREEYSILLQNYARLKCCTKTLYGFGYDYKYYYLGFGDVICTNARTSFPVNCSR